uniref:Uncharacterized protein n=1 Tax=Amphimedon queenslandica TaxID=400682 RepID=A0A1X7TQZ2_AMPQE
MCLFLESSLIIVTIHLNIVQLLHDVIFVVSIFRIITELETLKEEAAEVQRKMEETDTVMAEVD